MLRVVSETLTLHTQSLIACLEQYGWMSWKANGPIISEIHRHYEEVSETGYEAACDKVAELITDTIARYNARCPEPWPKVLEPQFPRLPFITAADIRVWTARELFEEHIRILKPSELIVGALNWYLSRFWEELVNVGGDEDNRSQVFWYDREAFHRSLKTRGLCDLFVVDPCRDLELVASGYGYADLVQPLVNRPLGIFKQEDAWVLTDDITGYLLDSEDIHSDQSPVIDYYHFNEPAARFLHFLK